MHTRRRIPVAAFGGLHAAQAARAHGQDELKGRRNPFIAREGVPFVVVAALLTGFGWFYGHWQVGAPAAVLLVWLVLVFRDPRRMIPASPLGVVSPVDGEVIEVGVSDHGIVNGEVHRIRIAIDSFGTYTARSPSEGKIMDLRGDLPTGRAPPDTRGLWVRTDENQDVLLQFHGYRLGVAPRAFIGFGERVGQGQRCAYLRLAREAEIQVPLDSRVLVEKGQAVRAGSTLIARLPHP